MDVRELLKLVECLERPKSSPLSFPYGGKVAIRTVTLYYTGEVDDCRDGWVYLTTGAWIPNTGRWSEFVSKGTYAECEPCGRVAVALGSIVDVVPWVHDLPTKVK